jgi:chromosome segregation ATPase
MGKDFEHGVENRLSTLEEQIRTVSSQLEKADIKLEEQNKILQKIYNSQESQKKDIEIIRNDYVSIKGDNLTMNERIKILEEYIQGQKSFINFAKWIIGGNAIALISILFEKFR